MTQDAQPSPGPVPPAGGSVGPYPPAGQPAPAGPYPPAGGPVGPYPPVGRPGAYPPVGADSWAQRGVAGPPAYPAAAGGPCYGGWSAPPRPVAPPPADAVQRPRRVDAVPGTRFGVVYFEVPPVTSGPAVSSLVAGIGSIGVALLVAVFGLAGAQAGWGGWAAGAFAVPSGLAGLAAVLLGLFGRRQINRPAPPPAARFTGRGLAVAGISCGAAGLGVTVLSFAVTLLVTLT